MGRDLRHIPQDLLASSGPLGPLIEVTTRTMQGRLLLRPSPALREIIIGILARSARMYKVSVVGFVYLSNHFHLLLRTRDVRELSAFMCFVNGNVAREAARLHGWPEKFWSRRFTAILISNEEDKQLEKLRYLFAQGSKEGLVQHPEEWPGASSVQAQMRGEVLSGVWFDRTAEGDARRCGRKPSKYEFASRETLKLSPPPVWDGIEPKEACRRVCEMVCEVVAETSAALRERGERPLGVQRILRQHPHSRPIALKRSPAPRFHASSWDVRKRLEEAYKAFLVAYRQAAAQLRSGDLGVEFPAQCFPPALPSVRGPTLISAS